MGSSAPSSVAAPILLVDDSKMVRIIIPAELQVVGFRVKAVPTLTVARRMLESHRDREPFGLVILDLQLPDGHGLDFLRELREHPAYAALPVVILAQEAQFAASLRALGVGPDDCVGKPHSRRHLISRVRFLMGIADAF